MAELRAGARWRIEMFGGLRMERLDGTFARFRPQKMAGLLAYLAYYRRRSHPRDALIEILWPGDALDTARHKLSVALSALRQELEPPGVPDGSVLLADRITVAVEPSAFTVDVEEFETAVRAAAGDAGAGDHPATARDLEAALALYQGPLLPGHYEEWVLVEQRRLAELQIEALRHLARALERAGEPERALDYARRAVNGDPLREEPHQDLIRLLLATGQPAAAHKQLGDLRRLLKEETGTDVSDATRALFDNAERQAAVVTPKRPVPADAATLRPPAAEPGPAPAGRAAANPRSPEPVGGAVPLQSEYYIARATDAEFEEAIARRDSIVLVKGARQVGKTSLLSRGLAQAREAGLRAVVTDLERLNARSLESSDTLLLTLAETIAEQLDLDVDLVEAWSAHRSPNLNFTRFLRREVLGEAAQPLIWAMDEVDRLFTRHYGSEVFGLFRSWHNERALDPGGPWSRLTLAISYATEAHLFISDLNNSPFNVGTRLTLEDFTFEQVVEMNRRYGQPLRDTDALRRCSRLVGGHPYLLRRALHELVTRPIGIDALEAQAARDEWIFGDHLRRLLAQLQRDADLCEAVRRVLGGEPCPGIESFYRLRSAGVLVGEVAGDARLRCQLYATYLARHLGT